MGSINDYGLNAYKNALYQGYKRFARQNGSNSPEENDSGQDSAVTDEKTVKIPPPDIPGRVMDFKI